MKDKACTKRLAMPVVLLAFVIVPAQGQQTPRPATEATKREVLKVDDEFNRAVQAKDTQALEGILANELSWIARGDRLDKRQVIADVASENLHFKSLTHDSIIVKIIGNTAIVTGHSSSILDYKGKLFDAPRLFTNVYMKIDGRWQLVAHHVSELAKS